LIFTHFLFIGFIYTGIDKIYLRRYIREKTVYLYILILPTMKTIAKLFILSFIVAGIMSCRASIPLQVRESENNATYKVSYLFEHDGCKVYRFFDMGNWVYFTTRGDVTAIKNDSTGERTVTIYKDSIPLKK